MAQTESSVRHIVAHYLYADYLQLKNLYLANVAGANESKIAGLCFKTLRTDPYGGYNDSLKAILVYWNPPSAGGAPDAIGFFDAETVTTPAVPPLSVSRPVIEQLNVISTLDIVQQYQGTREFDYVFIDIASFLYLAAPTSNGFYQKDATGNYVMPSTTGSSAAAGTTSYINLNNRGLLMARATFVLQGPTSFERFRTLRFYPSPEPVLSPAEANRPAIAYVLGAACPPVWRDLGNEILTITDAIAPAPIMMSTVTEQKGPDDNDPKCDCVTNNINMLALHQKLIEDKIIDKDPAPVYKIRLWPWLVALVTMIVFALIGMYSVVKHGAFSKFF